jgi:hypothetical protein
MEWGRSRIALLVLVFVTLVALDLLLNGGQALAGVGQYGRHG